jgi:hypothetical protein
MTALIVVLAAAAVLVGLGFAFGGPALAVLLILAGLLVVGWFVIWAWRAGRRRRSRPERGSKSS